MDRRAVIGMAAAVVLIGVALTGQTPAPDWLDGQATGNSSLGTRTCRIELSGPGVPLGGKWYHEDCDDGDPCTDDQCGNWPFAQQFNGRGLCANLIAYGRTNPQTGKLCYSCGDGLQQNAEQCDDGNTVSGDGCNASCRKEQSSSSSSKGHCEDDRDNDGDGLKDGQDPGCMDWGTQDGNSVHYDQQTTDEDQDDPWDDGALPRTLDEAKIYKASSTDVDTSPLAKRSLWNRFWGFLLAQANGGAQRLTCIDAGGLVFESNMIFLLNNAATHPFTGASCFFKAANASVNIDTSKKSAYDARTIHAQACYSACYNAASDWIKGPGSQLYATTFSGKAHRIQLEWCQSDCVCNSSGEDATKQIAEVEAKYQENLSKTTAAFQAEISSNLPSLHAWIRQKYEEAVQTLEDQRDEDKAQLQQAITGTAGQCFQQCMVGASDDLKNRCSQGNAECCRAECVTNVCPFVRTPTRNPIAPPPAPSSAPSGNGGGAGGSSFAGGFGTTGGDGGTDGGDDGEEGSSSSQEGEHAGDATGTSGGTGTSGSAQASTSSRRASAASRASSAISESTCYTVYPVPPELRPGSADMQPGGTEWGGFSPAMGPIYAHPPTRLDRFLMRVGKYSYTRASPAQSAVIIAWVKVLLDGSFTEVLKIDVDQDGPLLPGDVHYDGADTVWSSVTEACHAQHETNPCNFLVEKYTISTKTRKQVVIPNDVASAKLGSPSDWTRGGMIATDGSLWLPVNGRDVVFQVRPDMTVRSYAFQSPGCADPGQVDRGLCRGASLLAEDAAGNIWFGLNSHTNSGRSFQIGKITPAGAGALYPVFPSGAITGLYRGYDERMWFRYTLKHPDFPDSDEHVGTITRAGVTDFIPLRNVSVMAAGQGGMWYLGPATTQGSSAVIVGFVGSGRSSAARYPILTSAHLVVDSNQVPWSTLGGASLSVPTAVKFACGSSPPAKSRSSSRSSASSRVSSASVSIASHVSSASSTSSTGPSSARTTSSSFSLACPADLCGAGGSTYCAGLSLRCLPLSGLPCFECVMSPGSSRSSIFLSSRSSASSRLSSASVSITSHGSSVLSSTLPSSSRGTSSSANFASRSPGSPMALSGKDIPMPSSSSQVGFGADDMLIPSSARLPPWLTSSSRALPTALLAARTGCGNGTTETGEECDDRNARDFDGCSADCLLERGRCGDRIVQTLLGEQCEPATHDASLPFGCSPHCRFESALCGNGVVDAGEQCDQAAQNRDQANAFCRRDCSFARCGDGIIDFRQVEQCDDGNRVGGDGCTARCLLEPAAAVPVAAQVFNLPLSPGTRQPAPGPQTSVAPFWQVLPQTTVPTTTASGPGALLAVAAGAAAGVGYLPRVGGGVAVPVLPHHRTYGSVSGGSV